MAREHATKIDIPDLHFIARQIAEEVMDAWSEEFPEIRCTYDEWRSLEMRIQVEIVRYFDGSYRDE